MKEFKDLEFNRKYDDETINHYKEIKGLEYLYDEMKSAKRAVMYFDNGYGVSVICGHGSYSNEKRPYELAVLNSRGSLDYSTPVTNDVEGYQTENDITRLMKQVQEL